MDIEARVDKLEKHVEDINAWQRNAEVTEARRVANETHLDKRLDHIETSMASGFTNMERNMDERFRPFHRGLWLIVATAVTGFIGVVLNFALSGGFNVGG